MATALRRVAICRDSATAGESLESVVLVPLTRRGRGSDRGETLLLQGGRAACRVDRRCIDLNGGVGTLDICRQTARCVEAGIPAQTQRDDGGVVGVGMAL